MMKRSPAPSDTASITVTAGEAITVDKNMTLTVFKPTNDTAKTPSVALTAFEHFFYNFYLIFHVFCLSDSNSFCISVIC